MSSFKSLKSSPSSSDFDNLLVDDNDEKYNDDLEKNLTTIKEYEDYIFGFEDYIEDYNHLDSCYYCANKILMEIFDIKDYIKENINKRSKKNIIIMLYRLYPHFFDKPLENILKITQDNYEAFCFRYDIYFNNNNLNNVVIQCDLCHRRLCEKHLSLVPFSFIKSNKNNTKSICRFCIINYSTKTILKNLKI